MEDKMKLLGNIALPALGGLSAAGVLYLIVSFFWSLFADLQTVNIYWYEDTNTRGQAVVCEVTEILFAEGSDHVVAPKTVCYPKQSAPGGSAGPMAEYEQWLEDGGLCSQDPNGCGIK